jgi:hypothetical protein
MQVMGIVFAIGAKALLDGKLGREAVRERNPTRGGSKRFFYEGWGIGLALAKS